MTGTRQRTASALEMTSKPRLPRAVRLRHDRGRDRRVLLAPEPVFWPDPIADQVLRLCDGTRDIGTVADELAGRFYAPPTGRVLPCHAAETIPVLAFDNVRDRSLRDIWLNSDAFKLMRQPPRRRRASSTTG